jgi:hypothetical protein
VDVSAWLKSLDLVECALVFKDNAIGVDVIADLTAEDLREIGVSAVGPGCVKTLTDRVIVCLCESRRGGFDGRLCGGDRARAVDAVPGTAQ